MQKYQEVIIGSGPGGVAAARILGRAGRKVALIENRNWGGVCLNHGCVPTKLLLGAVSPLGMLDNLARGRVIEGAERVNFPALRERVRLFIEAKRKALALDLIESGVYLIKGEASCLSPTCVRVVEKDGHTWEMETEHIIFACGSRTSTYPGLMPDGRIILGSTGLLEQRVIPSSLIICGGGYIGIELADFFMHMGTKVVIAEAAPQIAPAEDSDIAMEMRLFLERRGVLCLTGVRAISLAVDEDGQAKLTLANDSVYTAEKGLVATGRMPNTENLDPDRAGIALNRRGFITTDYYLRSSDNSWAIGDVNGKTSLAHAATHQGEYVARTILGMQEGPYKAGPCPSCVHGSQEIMRVGMTEREALAMGGDVAVSKASLATNVVAQATGNANGFVKVVWRNGAMAGIAAIGSGVSQLAMSGQLLLVGKYQGEKLDKIMVAHPTLDETLVQAVRARRVPVEY